MALSQCSKSLLQFRIMRLSPDQRQVRISRGMLYTELAIWTPSSIDHLGVIVIPLCLDLVTQVFLINILLRLVIPYSIPCASSLNDINHFIPCANVWSPWITPFKWFDMVLPWSDDCFLWVGGADIIVLMPFSAGDSICCIRLMEDLPIHWSNLAVVILYILIAHLDHLRGLVWNLDWWLAIVCLLDIACTLSNVIACHYIISDLFSLFVKWNMDSSICISYQFNSL